VGFYDALHREGRRGPAQGQIAFLRVVVHAVPGADHALLEA
jgi:hypothetical protein